MDLLKSSCAFSSCTMDSGVVGRGSLSLMSCHRVLLVEPGALPFRGLQHLPEVLNRMPHILEARVQRGEAEAQDVGMSCITGAEIADHPTGDECLHDGVRTLASRKAD